MDRRKLTADLPLFSDRFCVYCGQRSDDRDHAPPKCLLRKPYPKDLITVPSCKKCNGGFSLAEGDVKAILATVSFDENMMKETQPGGKIHRAKQRDKRLRQLIDGSLAANGTFVITKEVLRKIEQVLSKCVRGLYFWNFGKVLREDQVGTLDIQQPLHGGREDLAVRFCGPGTRYGAVVGWPEVTPSGRALEKAVLAWTQRVSVPRRQEIAWMTYQPGVFEYGFAKGGSGGLVCILEIHKTIFAAFLCPQPMRKGTVRHR